MSFPIPLSRSLLSLCSAINCGFFSLLLSVKVCFSVPAVTVTSVVPVDSGSVQEFGFNAATCHQLALMQQGGKGERMSERMGEQVNEEASEQDNKIYE